MCMHLSAPITSGAFKELLRDLRIYDRLHPDPSEDFLVEVAFLNFLDDQGQSISQYSKIETEIADDEYTLSIQLTHETDGTIMFLYQIDKGQPQRHGLVILQDDNVMYSRRSSQDPRTEWDVNGMANDPTVTDENGNLLFEGEPVNI